MSITQLSLLTILIIVCIHVFTQKNQYEHFASSVASALKSTISIPTDHIKMKRCKHLGMTKIEKNVWDKFKKVNDESWQLFVPCGYTMVEKELAENDYFNHRDSGYILGILGADNFAAKDRSWKMLKDKYGRKDATRYMPESWVTYDEEDMKDFYKQTKQNVSNNDMYIMKKNIQQQQGLHIFKDPSEANDAFERGYVVIQRVLQDPFLINGRKINLRVYVLIVCSGGKKYLYVYDDGFVYYSRAMYNSGTNRDEIITSGYISRDVYENSPLTTKDFLHYLEENYGSTAVERFIASRNKVLHGFMEAAKDNFCVSEKIPSRLIFSQSFGVDIQPDKNLDVKILEWNKGQSLEVMDHRDGSLKQKMIDDIYRTLGLIDDDIQSGFKKVWES